MDKVDVCGICNLRCDPDSEVTTTVLECGFLACQPCLEANSGSLIDCQPCETCNKQHPRQVAPQILGLEQTAIEPTKPEANEVTEKAEYVCKEHGAPARHLCLDFSCPNKSPFCDDCVTNLHGQCPAELQLNISSFDSTVALTTWEIERAQKRASFEARLDELLQEIKKTICTIEGFEARLFVRQSEITAPLTVSDIEKFKSILTSKADKSDQKIYLSSREDQKNLSALDHKHQSLLKTLRDEMSALTAKVAELKSPKFRRSHRECRSQTPSKDSQGLLQSAVLPLKKQGSLLFSMTRQYENLPLLLDSLDKVIASKVPISLLEKQFEVESASRGVSFSSKPKPEFIREIRLKGSDDKSVVEFFGPNAKVLLEFVDKEVSIASEKTQNYFPEVCFVTVRRRLYPEVFKLNSITATPVFVLWSIEKARVSQTIMPQYSHGLVVNMLNELRQKKA